MNYNDILAIFRSNNNKRKDEEYKKIYEKAFPPILKMIQDNGGCYDDALDVFHEAWIVFLKKLDDASFQLTAKAETFMYSIAAYKWGRIHKKLKSISPLIDNDELFEELYDEEREKKIQQLEIALEDANFEKCYNILKDFYWHELSMEQLAINNNFSTADSAKNQKARCMKKLKHLFGL